MTSNLTADTHRPPFFRPPPRPSHSRNAGKQLPASTPQKQDVNVKVEQSEPAEEPLPKRRKIESPALQPSAAAETEGNAKFGPLLSATLATATILSRMPYHGSIPPSEPQNDAQNAVTVKEAESGNSTHLPPLPPRPWEHATASRDGTKDPRALPRTRLDFNVSSTPYTLESPHHAPTLPHRLADFFPWVGNHPEDVLDDRTVKDGQCDKVPSSWNESTSARPALYGNLKHRAGTHVLSGLFNSVLQLRAQDERITTGSSFKPPPRVTLTEAKRKAWLADLANAAVPLKRLSRTIPQGIRGQLLLDQCLANEVPLSRAIWFAKCVGANEVRTLKRKGTSPAFALSTEMKWINDWTKNICQFVDAHFQEAGNVGWRKNMDYCLRLVTRLYTENILDKDCFIDWLLTSMANASLDSLPFWLMTAHIFTKDIVRLRIRGRFLAQTILDKLMLAQLSDEKVFKPLIEKLKQFVRTMVSVCPRSFLIPDKWMEYKDAFEGCFDLNIASNMKLLTFLRHINERALGFPSPHKTPAGSPRYRVIRLLDDTLAPFDVDSIRSQCLAIFNDLELFLRTILEWSCSRYRSRKDHLYLGLHLLRSCSNLGYDLTAVVLDFLEEHQGSRHVDTSSLHHIVNELVRSKNFSTSKYLQWLTACGGLRRNIFKNDSETYWQEQASRKAVHFPRCDDEFQLLTELPLWQLPAHVQNLRSALLSRAGLEPGLEEEIMERCKRRIRHLLNGNRDTEIELQQPKVAYESFSWTIKSDLSRWLKDVIESEFEKDSKDSALAGKAPGSDVTVDHFLLVRDIIELIGDMSILTDILHIMTRSNDQRILASTADTINAHFDTFSAIGALTGLSHGLFRAYASARLTGAPLPAFVISLLDLSSRLQSTLVPIKQLREDLVRGDRISAIAAYSPFSDGMAESLQNAGSNFVEEFEAVLYSEPNMKEDTMGQLFNLVVDRLQKNLGHDSDEEISTLCQLLARLRMFKPAHFDHLMSRWIASRLASSIPPLESVILTLVYVGCLKIEVLTEFCTTAGTGDTSSSFWITQRAVSKIIGNLIAKHETSPDAATYRFSFKWSHYFRTSPTDAWKFIALVGNDLGTFHPDRTPTLTELVSNAVIEVALHHGQDAADLDHVYSAFLENAIDRILDTRELSHESNIASVIDGVTEWSLPLCRLQLRMAAGDVGTRAQGLQESVAEALFSTARDSPLGPGPLTAFISVISNDVASLIRSKAEQAFFSVPIPCASPLVTSSSATADVAPDFVQQASKYLEILAPTAFSIKDVEGPRLCARLNEKLTLIWRCLNAQHQPSSSAPTSSPSTSTPLAPPSPAPTPLPADLVHLVSTYLALLLRTVSHHSSTLAALPFPAAGPTPARTAPQPLTKLILLLCSIAIHPILQTPSMPEAIASHTLDSLTTLADPLPAEHRILIARCLKDKLGEPGLAYLFGSLNNITQFDGLGTGLVLVKEGKGVVGSFRAKEWEVLGGSAGVGGDGAGIDLRLFQARRGPLRAGP